ncbi:TMEM165/GDT1 family protein [Sedimentibacter sp. MB31-C6]|uniref:TMEM165/GDT1 family protein n=1 Tax=Sedimentibacter sp. MB31-C6 TaxID=3109366 RepID=UPI002DDCCCC1|nr:TMEM165/GDT1 family protein [Sedimentibacter sp. MB36-C1]WSI05208.1 TMEM165/GDT1 family protein [Sedimentibacter sp. MB36-C1]
MLHEFIETFFLIFVAELGDKTQVMLMTLAARFSMVKVLIGIFIGVTLNHGLAIIIGSYISNIVANELLQVFAGFIFIVFGFFSFADEDCETEKSKKCKFSPVLTVALTFFLGELGDKTQLTAMTLAMEGKYHLMILFGSIAAMLAEGILGIIVGTTLTKHIPSFIIKIISGTIFIIFGVTKIITTLEIFKSNYIYQSILIIIIILISFLQILKIKKR